MVSLVNLCQQLGTDTTYWIAYSGGLDSHVLLHAMSAVRNHLPIRIKAIHVHHGLSPNADAWALHCAQMCSDLNIDFVPQKITVEVPKGKSLEEIARKQRYAVFEQLLSVNDFLLTAHHQNDQAETVLLQLMRGAGPKGLAAMPDKKIIGKGHHLRPLLNYTRQELQHYAEIHQLKWIEDESNANTQFSRNFLRHEVMPLLEKKWPATVNILARTAANCADTNEVASEIIRHDLAQAINAYGLSINYIKQLLPARQRLILREWIDRAGLALPSAKKLQHILSDALLARDDKSPVIKWGDVALRRYQNNFYLTKINSKLEKIPDLISWDLSQPCVIPGIGTLLAKPVQGQGLRADSKHVTVRFRQGGEQCQLPGRAFHHSLKNLFQEWTIPPWERDKVPLIYVGNVLAAIVGHAVCEGFEAKEGEKGFSIQTEPEI